jgi:hypothetical protein
MYSPQRSPAGSNQTDLVVLQELLEAEEVTPVIDRTYPLCEVCEVIWKKVTPGEQSSITFEAPPAHRST